jgi:hypothetical protein
VVRLIEDKERAWPKWAEGVFQSAGVGFVSQQAVRDDEAGAYRPWVGGEAMGTAHSSQIVAVKDREAQAEFLCQLVLPLDNHCRRRRNNHKVHASSQQHLAKHEPSLNGFAKTHIIGDEEVHPRQLESALESGRS